MVQNLKSRYAKRHQINENIRKADRQLLVENRTATLLIEAMDEGDLQKASAIIDKLRAVKGKGVKSLDAAIDSAETQLNKYTAGGPLTKAWTKMKNVVGINNPLVKFMTFANALETGFKQMPTILKNNLGGIDINANQDKTLTQLITDPDKQKITSDNMLKALSPKGFFGAFKKVPYVDKNTLVQDLMNVPIKNLASVIQQINSGPSSDQIATDIKDVATQKNGNVADTGTTGSQPSQDAAATQGTSGTKDTTKTSPTAGTGETPDRPTGNVIDTVYKQLSNQLVDAAGNEQRAKAILKLLADEGKLKV